MPRPRKGISQQTKAQLRVSPQVPVKPSVAMELDAYLEVAVNEAIKRRDVILPRVEKWRRTLSGTRAIQTFARQGASNLSVPLIIWARVAARARLTESILDNPRLVSVESLPTRDKDQVKSTMTIANNLARFLSVEIWNSRGLGGREAVEKLIAEMVDLGSGALKIVPMPDTVKKLGPLPGDTSNRPRETVRRGQVRWEHVSLLDLLWKDGFGTDTQAMPFIGHQFTRTWSQIKSFAMLGHYDKAIVKEIEGAFNSSDSALPISLRNHDTAEIYLDWDVDDDGIEEAIVVDWHIEGRKRMRTNWNPYPEGTRPLLVGQFDLPPDIKDLRGHGINDKLEGSQDEIDAIHNIAIEAGKRGAAHILVVKENTRAEEEFGGETDVLPGEVIVTSNPAEDIVAVPMGDANAALATIALEGNTRGYVQDILGFGQAQAGNLKTAQRVPSQLGSTVMSEGRMPIRAALSSISNILTEAAYMTVDLQKQQIPMEALTAVMGEEDAQALANSVFNLDDASIRSSFLIRINAADAAIESDERQRELTLLGQVLFPYYDRLQALIITITSPELPPQAKEGLMLLVERMERGIEAMLSTVDSIPTAEELMVSIGALKSILTEADEAIDESEGGFAEDTSLVGDLGAEVT